MLDPSAFWLFIIAQQDATGGSIWKTKKIGNLVTELNFVRYQVSTPEVKMKKNLFLLRPAISCLGPPPKSHLYIGELILDGTAVSTTQWMTPSDDSAIHA